MPRSTRFDLIAHTAGQHDDDLAGQLAGVFNRLSTQLREARLLRRENDSLRDENRQLRAALADCVESCGDYLAPALEAGVPEDADRERAQRAIGAGRALLARSFPVALPE